MMTLLFFTRTMNYKKFSFLVLLCFVGSQLLAQGYETGKIKRGVKVGVWMYYDQNEECPSLVIDYDKASVICIKPDHEKYMVKLDSSNWVLSELSRQPRYIGSYQELMRILGKNISYPKVAKAKRVQAQVFLEFEISEHGRATKYQVYNDPNNYFTDEVIEAFKLVPDLWLAGIYQSKAVPAKMLIPIEFRINNLDADLNGMTESDFLGKKLNTVVVMAYL
ncbi:energy transducer TonB [Limibacter armeniacum]|uniref:energy transducer TonB n=1 Tax=Limibacter armeniacum TaxID=466084 RepID=UPI002FE5C384